jgi:hypothetical protein
MHLVRRPTIRRCGNDRNGGMKSSPYRPRNDCFAFSQRTVVGPYSNDVDAPIVLKKSGVVGERGC